jgi:hypothetical protein
VGQATYERLELGRGEAPGRRDSVRGHVTKRIR